MISLAFAAYAIAWGAALLGLSAAALALTFAQLDNDGCRASSLAVTRFAGTGLALAAVTGGAITLHLWS